MASVLVLFFLLWLAYNADAHGFMGRPPPRDVAQSAPGMLWQWYMPIRDPTVPAFQCRGWKKGPNTETLTAGEPFGFWFGEHAPHVGPCYFYIGDDTVNKWYKILEFQDCGKSFGGKQGQGQTERLVNVTLPSWVPACETCVLRWEWHALHQRAESGGSVEWYTQCADVKVINPRSCQLQDAVAIPGHVPSDPNQYWYPYNTATGMRPFKHTPPPITTFTCSGSSPPTTSPPSTPIPTTGTTPPVPTSPSPTSPGGKPPLFCTCTCSETKP